MMHGQKNVKLENSSLITIWQERVLYVKTITRFLSYLPHLYLEREMFRIKVVNKIRTHIVSFFSFFWNSCCLLANVKNVVQPGRPQMTIGRMLDD